MRTSRAALVSAVIAHALAWAAALYLLLAAAYVVETVEATLPGEQPADPVRTTETFVEVNGFYGMAVALAPAVLTGVALFGLLALRDRHALRMTSLWVPAIAIAALCFAAILSIGLLYVPAAVALTVAALADVAHRPSEA